MVQVKAHSRRVFKNRDIYLEPMLRALRVASEHEEDSEVEFILEELEDHYGVELTKFYGEDFSDPRMLNKLRRKLVW